MNRYRVSQRAAAELHAILQYSIAECGEQVADEYMNRLRHTMELLAEFPYMGKSSSALGLGLRRFDTGSHTLFYRLTVGGVLVTRVAHQRQQA